MHFNSLEYSNRVAWVLNQISSNKFLIYFCQNAAAVRSDLPSTLSHFRCERKTGKRWRRTGLRPPSVQIQEKLCNIL